MDKNDKLQLQNYKRHDELVLIKEANESSLAAFVHQGNRGCHKLEEKHKLAVKGIQGPCVVRPLAYFDVGSSFFVDTLHNVYLGVFVSGPSNLVLELKANFDLAMLVEHVAERYPSKRELTYF